MDWLTAIEIVGMIATAIFIGLLIKEFKTSIKESNEGKVSKRCDLD